MTEASGGGGRSRAKRRFLQIVQRSMEDEDFRRRLLGDTKVTLEQELGSGLPQSVEVRAVEESTDIIYLVLPSASAEVGEGGGEISEQ